MASTHKGPPGLPTQDFGSGPYRGFGGLPAVKMRFERGNHPLQPTALVHEAYLRLAECSDLKWLDRTQILRAAAHVMRHILVDHARSHHAEKRGGHRLQVTL